MRRHWTDFNEIYHEDSQNRLTFESDTDNM